MWRRGDDGQLRCNACGIYFKNYGKERCAADPPTLVCQLHSAHAPSGLEREFNVRACTCE